MTNPLRVTFFSDSISVGQGVSIYKGWVTLVAQALDELDGMDDTTILVTNASVNGRTTRQALEDMPYHVQSSGVDILIVQFGLNDCNYWQSDNGVPRVSQTAFIANLEEIIERGRRFGAKHIFLNNNHPTTRTTKVMTPSALTYEESNRSYNQAMRELAGTLPDDVSFQDIEAYFQTITKKTPLAELLLEDGLHLSAEGHKAYFALMLPLLRDAVRKHSS